MTPRTAEARAGEVAPASTQATPLHAVEPRPDVRPDGSVDWEAVYAHDPYLTALAADRKGKGAAYEQVRAAQERAVWDGS